MNAHLRQGHNSIHLLTRHNLAKPQEVLGTIFRKQLVPFGKWVNPLYPLEKMELDQEWAEAVIDNFNKKVVGQRIPVPLSHDDWDPQKNAGELVKLEVDGNGLYGYLDIRRPEVVQEIENGIIFDVSISFEFNYIDTKDGKEHGPALLHVALVNNPYLTKMKDFEKLTQAMQTFSRHRAGSNVDLAKKADDSIIMLNESSIEEPQMETATLKNEKDHLVQVTYKDADGNEQTKDLKPGDEVEVPKDAEADVKDQIDSAKAPVTPNADPGAPAPVAPVDPATPTSNPALDEDERTRLSRLERESRENKLSRAYETLLADGKVVPAQKEKLMALANVPASTQISLSKEQAVDVIDFVTELLTAGPQKVALNNERGNGKGGVKDRSTFTLSQDDREAMKRSGGNPDEYEKFVREGKIKLDEDEE